MKFVLGTTSNPNTLGHIYEFVRETYPDGSVYEGQKLNSKKQGRGKLSFLDGGFYVGDWNEDTMHGNGTLFYPSGQIAYEGEWRNDKFHGTGTIYNENPAKIYGEFDYTDFDRLGDYWIKYTGEFITDLKDGVGTLYLSHGAKFEGNFVQDMVHGKGKYTFPNGQQISGTWNNNKFERN